MHHPYIFPSFLTTRIFSLYFFRQWLTVEEEHILNFSKRRDIKFSWEKGPYVVKSRVVLPIIDNLLRSIGISLGGSMNYDPHQVISIRRQLNKNKVFEHQEVEGLAEKSHWSDYPTPMENVEVSQENPLVVVKTTKVLTLIASSTEVTCKGLFF